MDLTCRIKESLSDFINAAIDDVLCDYKDELEHVSIKKLLEYIDELEKEQYIYSTASNRTVQSITDDLIRLKKEFLDD